MCSNIEVCGLSAAQAYMCFAKVQHTDVNTCLWRLCPICPALLLFAMAGQLPCDITLKRVVSVECPGQKSPWIIDTMESLDGIEFVALKLRCTGFCRFIAGAFKDFKWKDQSFLQELAALRTHATIDAMEQKELSPFGEVEPTPAAKKKARKNARSKAAAGDMPSYVDIKCKQIDLADGSHVGPLTFKIKASLNVREAPSVELDPHVLHYVKHALLASEGSSEKESPANVIMQRTQHVHWREARGCWTAQKGARFKSFKPEDINDSISVETAHTKAARWASSEHCDDDYGDDDGVVEEQHAGSIQEDVLDGTGGDNCEQNDDVALA